MSILYLVRHGECDPLGVYLAGRSPGVHLNEDGRIQARDLAERLMPCGIHHVFSSPLERAIETAEPFCERSGCALQISDGLNEIDFGTWTGKNFEELSEDPRWGFFNTFRSATRVPGGEMPMEVQARMSAEVLNRARQNPDQRIAFFGHSDPLKTAIGFFLGMPIDLLSRIRIDTASVTVIELHEYGVALQCLNSTSGELPS